MPGAMWRSREGAIHTASTAASSASMVITTSLSSVPSGMSAAAMLIRLRDVGLLPEATVEYAFRTYARTWRTSEPEPIRDGEGLGAFEKPLRFERLVYRALAEEMISPVRAAQLLKRPLASIEQEIRGPRVQ